MYALRMSVVNKETTYLLTQYSQEIVIKQQI